MKDDLYHALDHELSDKNWKGVEEAENQKHSNNCIVICMYICNVHVVRHNRIETIFLQSKQLFEKAQVCQESRLIESGK